MAVRSLSLSLLCSVLFCYRLCLPTARSNPLPVFQLSLPYCSLLSHGVIFILIIHDIASWVQSVNSQGVKLVGTLSATAPSRPPPAFPPLHLTQFPATFIIAHPYLPLCDSSSQSIVFHSVDVSSPCPFCIGCVLDYVCHPGFLLNDGATDSVFTLRFSIFPSMAHWLVSSFFSNAFTRDYVWHRHVISSKTHWLNDLSLQTHGRVYTPTFSTLHFFFIPLLISSFVIKLSK